MLGPLGRVVSWLRSQYVVRWGSPMSVAHRSAAPSAVWTLAVWDREVDAGDLCDLLSVESHEVRGWLVEHHETSLIGGPRADIRITSKTSHPIAIEYVEAEVLSRSKPVARAIVKSPPAGLVEVPVMAFDLSEGSATRTALVAEENGDFWTEEPWFPNHELVLAPGEAMALGFVSRTGADHVTWRMRFVLTVRGISREIYFPEDGRAPLKTTGPVEADQHWFGGVAGLLEPPWLREVVREELGID